MDGTDRPDRKSQIIAGAFQALKKHGLPDLSYDLIAQEAGLSRQLIRYHFPDSEALMLAVCDHLAGLYRDALIATVGENRGAGRIDLFLDFYFDLLDATPKPRDDQVYDALMSLATASAPIRDTLRAQYVLLGQVLSHEFSVEYPELQGAPAEELSYLFVCLIYGHWKMVASLGLSEHHRQVTRSAMSRLIRSFRETGASPQSEPKIWGQ